MTKKISEPETDYIQTKRGLLYIHAVEKKIKISTLRGKLKKQSDTDINKQIEEKRQEWKRDI